MSAVLTVWAAPTSAKVVAAAAMAAVSRIAALGAVLAAHIVAAVAAVAAMAAVAAVAAHPPTGQLTCGHALGKAAVAGNAAWLGAALSLLRCWREPRSSPRHHHHRHRPRRRHCRRPDRHRFRHHRHDRICYCHRRHQSSIRLWGTMRRRACR